MDNQINELIKSIKICLEILIKDSTMIATEFQSGNTGRAINKLIRYIEDFSSLVQAIERVRGNSAYVISDLDGIKLRDVLLEMEKAMCNKDYVLLADILEYEVKDVLVEIQNSIEA